MYVTEDSFWTDVWCLNVYNPGMSNLSDNSIRRHVMAALCSLGLFSGCQRTEEDGVEQPEPQRVSASPAAPIETKSRTVVAYARLIPKSRGRLRFPVAGRVDQLDWEEGDRIPKGALIASLESSALLQRRTELRLRIEKLSKEAGSPAAIQPLQNQLTSLNTQIESRQLVAPFDCILSKRAVDVGDPVSPAVVAFEVAEDTPPRVQMSLKTSLASRLPEGHEIWIRVEGKVVRCRLTAVSDDVAEKNSVTVLADLTEDADSDFRNFDSVVEARFSLQTEVTGFAVPLGALRQRGDHWSVLVVEPTGSESRLAERTVTVLEANAASAVVSGNLNMGDLVVQEGLHRIVVGQHVTVSRPSRVPPDGGLR